MPNIEPDDTMPDTIYYYRIVGVGRYALNVSKHTIATLDDESELERVAQLDETETQLMLLLLAREHCTYQQAMFAVDLSLPDVRVVLSNINDKLRLAHLGIKIMALLETGFVLIKHNGTDNQPA